MKITQKQTIGENLLYFLVWVAIILVPVLNSQMMSELHVSWENVLITWRQIAPYLTIFLIHNFLIARRLLIQHKYVQYVLWDLLLNICVFSVVELYDRYYMSGVVLPLADSMGRNHVSFSNLDFYWNVVLGLFMCGANSGIKLMYQSLRDEQEMQELKQQNMQAEMDYLKYQINPHFFMNTLNNIHALIDIDTESAQNAVIELSKMLRYVLYDSEKQTITLEHDIQFLKNYIELMRIRYTDAVDIRVESPEKITPKVSIPPLLLIVFVENAFKHGVSANRPSFIHIRIESTDARVIARFSNSRRKEQNDHHTEGIGLKNVRKRLELIYGERNYSLRIHETPNEYHVILEIPILHA